MATHTPENLPAAMEELVRGQESAKMLHRLLTTQQVKDEADLGAGQPVSAAVLIGDVVRSFTKILSVLNSGEISQVPETNSWTVKSEESEGSSAAPRDRRGCYKRRKGSNSLTRFTPNLTDDGYQWRKYGQKAIQSNNFPRNYFRCTYKVDQGCPATKQVQMVSNDPPMYQIIYHGDHICKSLLKPPQIMLDCPREDSSILLSFKNSDNNGGFPFSTASCRSSTVNIKTEEEIHTQPWRTMQQNDPSSSDSSNYCLPSLGEQGGGQVPLSSSYCSFGNIDLLDLEDVFSYY